MDSRNHAGRSVCLESGSILYQDQGMENLEYCRNYRRSSDHFDFSVAGREVGQQYVFMFAAEYSSEFWREMIMNVFLFFPFGLTLSSVIGWRSVVVGFLMTVSVEMWQYFTGTGLAQGTDIICNTLGVAAGNLGTMMRKH